MLSLLAAVAAYSMPFFTTVVMKNMSLVVCEGGNFPIYWDVGFASSRLLQLLIAAHGSEYRRQASFRFEAVWKDNYEGTQKILG